MLRLSLCCALLLLAFVVGCKRSESYADTLQVFKTERELFLDMVDRREKLVEEHEERTAELKRLHDLALDIGDRDKMNEIVQMMDKFERDHKELLATADEGIEKQRARLHRARDAKEQAEANR